MRNFIQKEKLLSLVASQCVTDEHISNYLQGLSYEAWKVDKDLEVTEEVIVGKDEEDNDIIETRLVNVYEEVVVDIEAWKKENYALLRQAEYPPIEEYVDAVVKGDEEAIESYKSKCLAVKARIPK